MTPERYDTLKLRTEQLTDVVLAELDPSKWPGRGGGPLTHRVERQRYWKKRSANMTLALLTKIHTLVAIIERRSADPAKAAADDSDFDELDAEIEAAEKEAATVIAQMRASGRFA